MRTGIIGTGRIGGMLAAALIETGLPHPLRVCNRSREKAEQLQARFPDAILIEGSASALVAHCNVIFLCLKAKDAWNVLTVIAPLLQADQLLILTASTISLADLEAAVPCRVMKVIPSVTQHACAGAQLVMFGSRIAQSEQPALLQWFVRFGTTIPISEEHIRVCSDLTSCGPAILADWLSRMATAAANEGISLDLARLLVSEMTVGVGRLLEEEEFSFEQIVDQVAVPGGVTAAGLAALRKAEADAFAELFSATKTRQEEITRASHP